MRKLIAATAFAAGLTILAGCGDKDKATVPTEDENLQLNNAAEMLDASADGMSADENTQLGNGEEAVVDDANAAATNNAAEDAD